jgi:hypothetical protein
MCPMQIINRGIMFLTIQAAHGDDSMDREEWARALGEEIKTNQKATQEQHRVVAMNRDIIAENMPRIWEELCQEFQSSCTTFNEQVNPEHKLGCFRQGPHVLMIRPDAMREIVVATYDSDSKNITVRANDGAEHFSPRVNLVGSGSVDLISNSTRRQMTVVDIVQASLKKGILRK